MDRSRVLTLISVTYKQDASGRYEQDDLGQLVTNEALRDVFCNVTSVSASEFFEAGRAGIRPELRATLFAFDYHGETVVELEGVRYGVYRTYLGKGETVELYLERKAGV